VGSEDTREPRRPAGGGTTNGAAPRGRTRRSDPLGPEPLGGTSDPRAARARELHRKAAEADELAARYRLERDQLIRGLRAEDPARWSYTAIAAALGCSRELVALVSRRAG
jgi:hypothetical protein